MYVPTNIHFILADVCLCVFVGPSGVTHTQLACLNCFIYYNIDTQHV